MSNCKQKFLGLDSIDVLIKYIDSKIEENSSDIRVCTLQLFKYFKSSDDINYPSNDIFYDFDTSTISFPNNYEDSWNTLSEVMKSLKDDDLSKGSIYTSTRVQQGISAAKPDDMSSWSYPVKISGVNGRSGTEFRFSYNEICKQDERSLIPLVATEENQIVYFWSLDENGIWPNDDVPGNVWVKYTADGKDGVDGNEIHYQYYVTRISDVDDNKNPIAPNDNVSWSDSILNISKTNPYLWVRTQQTVAGVAPVNNNWSTPKLLSMSGQDGTVPDYTITLYCKGTNNEELTTPIGIIAPEKPKLLEDSKIEDYITNSWVIIPGEDEGIWWQCTFNVRGMDNKVLAISDPKRYNGVDGMALPGEFTKMLFRWSENQSMPEFDKSELIDNWKPEGWEEDPNTNIIEGPEISLWMIVCNINGVTDTGALNVISISDPVKISGPRGSLSYDYRIENRYMNGGSAAPRSLDIPWESNLSNVKLTEQYPYLWVKPILVYYKMKYSDVPNENNEYDVVIQNENPIIVGKQSDYSHYRASGLNGTDGNTKNNVSLTTGNDKVIISNFLTKNYYVFAGSEEIEYEINYNSLDFYSGYTCKFANIGSTNMIITVSDRYIIGYEITDKNTKSITLQPNKSIELICYKDTESNEEFFILVQI